MTCSSVPKPTLEVIAAHTELTIDLRRELLRHPAPHLVDCLHAMGKCSGVLIDVLIQLERVRDALGSKEIPYER